MESRMGNTDEFLSSQLRFDKDTSQLGPLGGADEDGMLMTLSSLAENAGKADKDERKRQKKEAKAERKRKRAAEQALKQAVAGGGEEGMENIDPTLHGDGGEAGPSNSGGDAVDDAANEAAEEDAPPPTKKLRGPRAKKVKPLPAPGYQEIIGPFPDADGVGPAPESMLDDNGNPLHPAARIPERKKHSVTAEDLKSQFKQPGAMQSYLAERWMATKELKRLEDAGVLTYKKGTFSEAEEQAVRQAVKYFQQSKKLTDDGLVDVMMSKQEKASAYSGLWSEIATSVPGRPVRFVQKYVKRLYDTRARKGKWTEEEDETLLSAYNATGGSWVKIAASVDRSEEDCRARWRDVLRSRADRDGGRWTKEDEANLLTAIKEANLASGKDEFARDPPWEVVTLKMDGKRTQMQCRKKWQSKMWLELMGLGEDGQPLEGAEAAEPSTPAKGKRAADGGKMTWKIKIDLLERLGEVEATTISGVDWEPLAEHFKGFTATTLSKAFKKLVHKAGGTVKMPLSDTVARTSGPSSAAFKSACVVHDDEDEEEDE